MVDQTSLSHSVLAEERLTDPFSPVLRRDENARLVGIMGYLDILQHATVSQRRDFASEMVSCSQQSSQSVMGNTSVGDNRSLCREVLGASIFRSFASCLRAVLPHCV